MEVKSHGERESLSLKDTSETCLIDYRNVWLKNSDKDCFFLFFKI